MYGIGLQLTSTTTIGGSYSPASLFTANEVGYVYDLNDATTLFKDTAGTLPVTAAVMASGSVVLQLAWAEANGFRRDSPGINALAPLIGLDAAGLDALFIAAAQIEA